MTTPIVSLRGGALDLSSLLAAACRETGLDDFGDESEFLPALERLLVAWRDEAGLNEHGRQVAWARTLGSLKNRLWEQSCLRVHPEIDAVTIGAPIVIVGPHRSGTTRLHRLLATDTRLAHLRTWEGLNPAPRILPAWPPHAPDVAERRHEAIAMLALRRMRYPLADAMHTMDADAAEEEMLLMNHTFSSFSSLGLYDIPQWFGWFLQADRRPAYRALVRQLKLVAWSRGDPTGRRWVLKNPQHMLDLPALLEVLPDAKLVFTHRDPLKTVGSTVSMMCHFAAPQTDRDCRASVRDTWLDFCESAARRCIATREGIVAEQQLDLHYDEIERDWQGAITRLYAFAGLPLDAATERAMAQGLVASSAAAARRAHRYRLEDFGLDEAMVESRMRFVRERYGIGYE